MKSWKIKKVEMVEGAEMNELIILVLEFMKIGLLSIGGGLATLPFLYELANKYPWLTPESLNQMIAVSESTPGALGVNMATYVGYSSSGFLGGVIATLGLVAPSLVIIMFISTFLEKFQENVYVQGVFNILRPCVVGLIAVAGANIMKDVFLEEEILALDKLAIFFILMILYNKYKLHPVFYILGAGVLGVILKL